MNCPKCSGTFVSHTMEFTAVDQCQLCGGYWFDGGEFAKSQSASQTDTRWMDVDLWKNQESFHVTVGALKCPRCGSQMAAIKYGETQVTVDTCANCEGVWLDKGEYEQILAALNEQVSSMNVKDYQKAVLEEAGEVITGDKGIGEELRDLREVLRMLSYRVLVENPKVREALLNFHRLSPFQ